MAIDAMPLTNVDQRMSRRAILRGGSLFMLGGAMGLAAPRLSALAADVEAEAAVEAASEKPLLRIGLVTDLHHADKPAHGSRHYRESSDKLAEAGRQFQRDKVDVVVELGDFIDAASSDLDTAAAVEVEQRYLREIQAQFTKLPGEKHHVLGNHCVDTLTKAEFLAGVGREKSYDSFDVGDFHFVVLDACYRSDGESYGRKNFSWTDANLPAAELAWLKADLKAADDKPTIVFTHQRLDSLPGQQPDHYTVKNSPAVRAVLEAAGNVLAVFQGHSHKNDHREIGGIHYTTLVAMVEGSGAANSGYSTLDLLPNHVLRLTGFRRQRQYLWT